MEEGGIWLMMLQLLLLLPLLFNSVLDEHFEIVKIDEGNLKTLMIFFFHVYPRRTCSSFSVV